MYVLIKYATKVLFFSEICNFIGVKARILPTISPMDDQQDGSLLM